MPAVGCPVQRIVGRQFFGGNMEILDWLDVQGTAEAHIARDEISQLRAGNANLRREVSRLQNICVMAHDRLLRGDEDAELLAILERAWKLSPNAGVTGAELAKRPR